MFSESDFEYAVENTEILRHPEQRIETFGNTSFHFVVISELMDEVNKIRVRNGRIEAHRPSILTPEHSSRLLVEGMSGEVDKFVDYIRQNAHRFAFLRYGFQIKASEVSEEIVSNSVETVISRALEAEENEPAAAVIRGVDDAWEVCLLKFTMDLVQKSAPDNLGDFKQSGFL